MISSTQQQKQQRTVRQTSHRKHGRAHVSPPSHGQSTAAPSVAASVMSQHLSRYSVVTASHTRAGPASAMRTLTGPLSAERSSNHRSGTNGPTQTASGSAMAVFRLHNSSSSDVNSDGSSTAGSSRSLHSGGVNRNCRALSISVRQLAAHQDHEVVLPSTDPHDATKSGAWFTALNNAT